MVRISQKQEYIVKVPAAFNWLAKHPYPYPPDNLNVFEEYFLKAFDERKDGRAERKYLPIFWTGFYVRANYGRDINKKMELQKYCDRLDRNEKYYTIVQYDDGILNDLNNLDIKVFSMSGNPIDYPLPLICPKHNYVFNTDKKDISVNFVGQFTTHPIRKKMLDIIAVNKKCCNWYTSTVKHILKDYCKVLVKSNFTLCPRGYGPTSFRIMEALQYGSIPVYISIEKKDFVLPHKLKFEDYGVLVEEKDLQDIGEIIESFSESDIKRLQKNGKEVFENYFTYEANREIILKNLA